MSHLTRLLQTFDYRNIPAFAESLAPSSRYGGTIPLMICSAAWGSIDKIFGLDGAAFVGLALVFISELITGIAAATVRGESLSSVKLSRFSLKVFCYLVLIGATYLLGLSFASHNKQLAAWVMDWLHIFLTMQIVLENTVSILENLAEINGKEKPAYIAKIQEKFKQLLG